MSKYKDMAKKRWEEKPGGSIRGQASNIVHRGKKNDSSNTHTAVPLSQLADPTSFAPPPRRTGTGLAPPPPPTPSNIKRSVVASPSTYQDPRAGKPAPPPPKFSHTQNQQGYNQQEVAQEQDDDAPKGPYRVNTTGLSTDHLPRPPGRRDGADGRSPPPLPPPSYDTALTHPQAPPKPAAPGLPPRLPARTNTSSTSSSSPPPTSSGANSNNLLNQGAVNRLGAAGVSVPGLGIGRSATSPAPPPPPPRQNSSGANSQSSQVSELQNRFARMNNGHQSESAPEEGTTWAQKQAALRTAASANRDPSSVSAYDARAALGTANNFRQRHGDQVGAATKSVGELGQRFGAASAQPPSPASSPGLGLAGKKKPPPPPPPKKKSGLGGTVATPSVPVDDEPPPIPLATKPQF